MMNTNAALQVTNFDFYGDSLIAIRDNATGKIYAAINHILKGIGFSEKQIEHQQKKILNDEVLKSHTLKFSGVDLGLPSVNEIWCISNRKLPITLAKIHITPKMKREQPEMSNKLLRYQDKCADVLASVFIDNSSVSAINLQPLVDAITTFSSSVITMQQDIASIKLAQENIQKQIPKKHFSFWTTKMFPKYQLLMDYFSIRENKDLYKELYKEFHNMYPDIELNQVVDDYCYENKLDNCYTLDAIEHDKSVRILFEAMVDGLLEKYELMSNSNPVRQKTIFDDVVENIPVNHQKGPIINE